MVHEAGSMISNLPIAAHKTVGPRIRTYGLPASDRDKASWNFWLMLLAVKPFVDVFGWDVALFRVAGVDVNVTRLVGVLVFVVTLAILAQRRPPRAAGTFWILLFFLSQLVTQFFAFAERALPLSTMANSLLRFADAFLIYWLFSSYWTNPARVLSAVRVIWLSTLGVSLVSLGTWYTGSYHVNVTGEVTRFAGLYNDAGGPSYNAVFCFAFAMGFLALRKQHRVALSGMDLYLILATCIVTPALLVLTITKSAIGMAAIFVIMWFGIYRRKVFLIAPVLVSLVSLWYFESESVRARVAPEMAVVVEHDYSEHALDSLGTGRFAVWKHLATYYSELPFLRQLFGTGHNFSAHNQYLAYLLQVGLFGLATFLAMLVVLLRHLFRAYRQTRGSIVFLAITLLCMFTAYGATGHPFDYTTLYWYVLIAMSTMNAPEQVLVPGLSVPGTR